LTSKLLKAVHRYDAIEAAWRVIQENARASTSASVRQEVEDFGQDAGRRLRSICYRLARNRFVFGKAKGIQSPKKDKSGRKTGKFRPIVLAPVESRIVQRSILDVLQDIPELSLYIDTRYSFGGVKKAKLAGSKTKRESPSAVPAAIKAILAAIAEGARYYVCADIKSFFTRISKKRVSEVVGSAVNDPDFIQLFEKAITTELSNMADLREKATEFPIEDIGVAQGNSLSPLLGNIALAKFDLEMNEGDCCCLRYIDDFIILAPSAKAANARLRKAVRLLRELSMQLSPEKSSKGASLIEDGLSFLGVEIMPGIIRPSGNARLKFLSSIREEFVRARKAFVEVERGKPLPRGQTLISTLKRIEGMVDGWGKHYWFCNDLPLLDQLDLRVSELVREFLGMYRDVRSRLAPEHKNILLGIPLLAEQKRNSFSYPSG
jgi:retron-type reverse transcriptase